MSVARDTFSKLYSSDVSFSTAPYDGVVTTPMAALSKVINATAGVVPLGTNRFADFMFIGPTEGQTFLYQLWLYLKIAPLKNLATDNVPQYVGAVACTGTVTIGAMTGAASNYILNTQLVADTVTVEKTAFGTFLESQYGIKVAAYSPGDDNVAILSVGDCGPAHFIRLHPYDNSSAATGNVLYALSG